MSCLRIFDHGRRHSWDSMTLVRIKITDFRFVEISILRCSSTIKAKTKIVTQEALLSHPLLLFFLDLKQFLDPNLHLLFVICRKNEPSLSIVPIFFSILPSLRLLSIVIISSKFFLRDMLIFKFVSKLTSSVVVSDSHGMPSHNFSFPHRRIRFPVNYGRSLWNSWCTTSKEWLATLTSWHWWAHVYLLFKCLKSSWRRCLRNWIIFNTTSLDLFVRLNWSTSSF